MKVNGENCRSIWYVEESEKVEIVGQRLLSHEFNIITIEPLKDFEIGFIVMGVSGAPLVDATTAYGITVQMQRASSDDPINMSWVRSDHRRLIAINLRWVPNCCKGNC